jgi:electron transfer DM13
MTRLLLKIPWFVSATAIVAAAAVLAIGANLLLSPYFERSFLDEADPLASSSAMTGGSPQPTGPTAAAAGPTARSAAGVLLQGEWRDGEPGHNGEGIARIIRTEDGKLVLRVEEFSVTNGPDLIVVLSPDDDGYADGSLNLGALKATDGNFNYEIPAGTDLTKYRSAVVWCQSFPTTFAYATLADV